MDEMVYGIVKSRPGKSIIRKLNSKLFYFLVNKLTNGMIPKDVSDYRLVDKKILDAIKNFGEFNRFYRGFFSWVGFDSKSIGVEFERQKRFTGASKALTIKVIRSALNAIFSFSSFPLRISSFFAFLFSVLSGVVLIYQLYNWIMFDVPFDGFGTIVGITLLVASLLFFSLSIIGQYIGLIYDESKSRPIYIIDEIH